MTDKSNIVDDPTRESGSEQMASWNEEIEKMKAHGYLVFYKDISTV
jgi:hypothetical protein